MSLGIDLAERGYIPDSLTRMGIRRLLRQRLDSDTGDPEHEREQLERFVTESKASPIALHTDKANEQHYEVPAGFYQLSLGKRLKYSSCLWTEGVTTLDQAEEVMLGLTCHRAELVDGQEILEIGCGWGSLTLWMAERYPNSRITAVSNSHSQREFIMGQAKARGFGNVEVITTNIADFDTPRRFDRVVSVECFEHLRNYQELFRRIAGWMKNDARMFVHIFTHARIGYPFEVEGDDNWLGRHFFTGGQMPADSQFLYFQDDLAIERHWRVNGTHYGRTARAWLDNLDRNRRAAIALFAKDRGEREAKIMVERWRIFFMSCEELWNFRRGTEWLVSHYRFHKQSRSAQQAKP